MNSKVFNFLTACQSVTTSDTDIDELFSAYDSVLSDIADRFAPVQTVLRRPDRRAPWFDDDCRKSHSESRRRERRYRRSHSSGDRRQSVNRRQWVEATRQQFQLYRNKKEKYCMHRITQERTFTSVPVVIL